MLALYLLLLSLVQPAHASAPVAPPPKPYALGEVDPKCKTGFYTPKILKFLDHWPPPTLKIADKRPVLVRAIKTPSQPDVIGVIKHFSVKFPLDKVVEVSEKFEEYPKIWEDVESVQVESRDRNRTVTSWVRKSPAFFLGKIRYRLQYVTDKSVKGRVVFRQQLIDGNSVDSTDALVILEKMGAAETRITVLNFFNPNAGPFRSLVEGTIWQKSLENNFKDDIAFRARLEHPDWDLDQITKEAERLLDQFPIEKVEYTDLVQLD